MKTEDLEVFRNAPFLFWVKDEEWRYLWANNAINNFAGVDVTGLYDADLKWADSATALVENDKDVMATGTPHFMHEWVDHHGTEGAATLSVCKWVDELDGVKRVFGISFVIPGANTHPNNPA